MLLDSLIESLISLTELLSAVFLSAYKAFCLHCFGDSAGLLLSSYCIRYFIRFTVVIVVFVTIYPSIPWSTDLSESIDLSVYRRSVRSTDLSLSIDLSIFRSIVLSIIYLSVCARALLVSCMAQGPSVVPFPSRRLRFRTCTYRFVYCSSCCILHHSYRRRIRITPAEACSPCGVLGTPAVHSF